MNWTRDDLIAVVAAPLLLFAVLRGVRALAPHVPRWRAAHLVGLWGVVMAALAALLTRSVTTRTLLVAWLVAVFGAWNVTRVWLEARRAGRRP
jgi:hypothetical protein